MLVGTGKAWGPTSVTLKCRPASERTLSGASLKVTWEERNGERGSKHQVMREQSGAGGRLSGKFCRSAPYTCSESMDFKRLVNFSELAQPHYITCSFGMKYLCKYRCCLTCFSPSFRTERYWRFRCSFSISVSVLVHSGSGQIVRCTVRNVCWKFGADTVTQREVIRGGNLKTYVYPL